MEGLALCVCKCGHVQEGSMQLAEVFTSEGYTEYNVLKRGKKLPGV